MNQIRKIPITNEVQDIYDEPVSKDTYNEPDSKDTYNEPASKDTYNEPDSKEIYNEPRSKDTYNERDSKNTYNEIDVPREITDLLQYGSYVTHFHSLFIIKISHSNTHTHRYDDDSSVDSLTQDNDEDVGYFMTRQRLGTSRPTTQEMLIHTHYRPHSSTR